MKAITSLTIFFLFSIHKVNSVKYEPTWESLDSRPTPSWYDEAKIGIFLHWGVYSVPSFGSEWFWSNWKGNNTNYVEFMENLYPKGFTYQEFAKDFRAEFFNSTEWAKLFKTSGAKYIILTSKHHDGYALWPSSYSFSWNSVDVGPHRDLIGELSSSIRDEGIRFGLYHSLYEWFNPMYLSDKESNFESNEFVIKKILPEMTELIEKYAPSVLWSDGEWEASDDYWKSKEFIAWLYNESPLRDEILVNDRWGRDTLCKHGDFYTCLDRFNPGTLQSHKWENAMTIDRKSWGYRRNAKLEDYMSIEELLREIVSTVSCGGNILINVGPTSYGTIAPIFEERLREMGSWLDVNGEAIYGSNPWTTQNDTSDIWYTHVKASDGEDVYAITLTWPVDNILRLTGMTTVFESITNVNLLGYGDLTWNMDNNVVNVLLPDKSKIQIDSAWVLKFEL